jgi:FtsZ-interacting cell division protein ZipA
MAQLLKWLLLIGTALIGMMVDGLWTRSSSSSRKKLVKHIAGRLWQITPHPIHRTHLISAGLNLT